MRKILLVTLLGLSAANLSGCVPLVATGVGVGYLMTEDRRTSGTYLLDEEIELKAASRIRDAFGSNAHASVTSFNRRVLLTGQVPDAATRAKAGEIAKGVPNVRDVQNELVVAGVNTLAARTNDGYVTAKVKTRFLEDKRFNAHHVKVVTEGGSVFLMGLVKHEEGDAAAEVAARTGGVSKVVKVFEYME